MPEFNFYFKGLKLKSGIKSGNSGENIQSPTSINDVVTPEQEIAAAAPSDVSEVNGSNQNQPKKPPIKRKILNTKTQSIIINDPDQWYANSGDGDEVTVEFENHGIQEIFNAFKTHKLNYFEYDGQEDRENIINHTLISMWLLFQFTQNVVDWDKHCHFYDKMDSNFQHSLFNNAHEYLNPVNMGIAAGFVSGIALISGVLFTLQMYLSFHKKYEKELNDSQISLTEKARIKKEIKNCAIKAGAIHVAKFATAVLGYEIGRQVGLLVATTLVKLLSATPHTFWVPIAAALIGGFVQATIALGTQLAEEKHKYGCIKSDAWDLTKMFFKNFLKCSLIQFCAFVPFGETIAKHIVQPVLRKMVVGVTQMIAAASLPMLAAKLPKWTGKLIVKTANLVSETVGKAYNNFCWFLKTHILCCTFDSRKKNDIPSAPLAPKKS